MKIKYLSLCLIGLSLGACSQHIVKPNTVKGEHLDQRAVNGLNAMFETSSFDINGKLAIQTDFKKSDSSDAKAEDSAASTQGDKELEKQIDKALKAQNIKLTQKEKNELYKVVSDYASPYSYSGSSGRYDSALSGLGNFLNDLQISYDGSVHYRQKLASLNLNMQYQKPTLSVQAKIPMVVDFNDYKFYTNYFALMPYLVNKESQDVFAYLDFSKFKGDLSKINTQKFVQYLKESNAISYLVAEPSQVSSVALTAQEKQNGVVEKIRLTTDIETLFVQGFLYNLVNEQYLKESILGQAFERESVEEDEVVEAASEAVTNEEESEYYKDEKIHVKAYESYERVQEIISAEQRRLNGDSEEIYAADVASACDEDEAACEVASEGVYWDEESEASEAYASAYDSEETTELMSERACEALRSSKTKIAVGAINFCESYYGIELLAKDTDATEDPYEVDVTDYEGSAISQLTPIFEKYQSTAFIDAKGFAALWKKHKSEIDAALAKDSKTRAKTLVDVSLDQQGRAHDVTYDVSKDGTSFGSFRVISQTQITNYGNATAIDKKKLREAKSLEEVAKGSSLERLVSGFSRELTDGYDAESTEESSSYESTSIYGQLEKLALDTYKRTGSYVKTYQAVFVVLYASRNPELVKYYSASDLNEIAELHAYYFNDDLPKPNATAQKRLDKLAEKHKLKSGEYFDSVGSSVAGIVESAVGDEKDKVYWKNLMKKAKTKQNAFALHYEKSFADEYNLNTEDKKNLPVVSKILAQAYADDVKGKLSKNSIKGLKEIHGDLIDYGTYRKTYFDLEKYATK